MLKIKEQMKTVTLIIILIFLVIGIYINLKVKKNIVSSNTNKFYTVNLEENICDTITRDNVTTIKKYNGSADKVIINKDLITSEILEIDSKAFLECSNLYSIMIDKTMVTKPLEIEKFEINNDFQDEQYVEYINTQEYSEAYKKYLELPEHEKNKLSIIPNKYDIPMSVIYTQSMEENYKVSEINEIEIPKKFDLRNEISITVENQASSSICYAYASLAAVETNLALKCSDYVDLSERHLANKTHGNSGGAFIDADHSYYKEKLGPIYKSDWTGNTSENIVARRYVTKTISMPTIDKGNIYTQEEINTIRNVIKKHIIQYGSLYASISSKIKVSNDIYVLNSEFTDFPNHAVSIIGWDDEFSKNNFPISNRPSADGAYLALNSYGKDWGENGCFWISYEDYWVENALRGVISVENHQENVKIENAKIIDTKNDTEITYKIAKGINAQIEVNLNVNKIINNEENFLIEIISPTGENIVDKAQISGNKIENNKTKILLNLDTSRLLIGDYKIYLKYNEQEIIIPISIKIDTFDFEINEDETMTITGYYGDEKRITIPEEFLGYKVTKIQKEAFINNELECITIYDNITEIGENIIDKSVIIYGNKDSYIEQYAQDKEYIFINVNETIIEGQGWYFEIENQKLYILENYPTKEYEYLKKIIKRVELKNSVTNILEAQFKEYENLEEVKLSNTIITIGDQAFYNCSKLQNIEITDEVNVIGTAAFYGCANLKNIKIPSKVTDIKDATFYMCTNLKNIEMPEGITSIGAYAFYDCNKLEIINIPDGVTNIQNRAFYNCTNLSDLKIPSALTTIGTEAFYGCIVNKAVERGTYEIEVPEIIRRATTDGDILNCGSDIKVINANFNTDKTKLEIVPGYGQIFISITSGNLIGFKFSIIVSGEIEYSDYDWTCEDVTAKLYVAKGEHITNNGGEATYRFIENGEFEFKYINLKGEEQKVIAKVDNIDKAVPTIIVTTNKNEDGFIEEVTASISDEQSGLWPSSTVGYAWSESNLIEPENWTFMNISDFENGIKEVSSEIKIDGLSGKKYLWFYKKALYDMVANGFERKYELISNEPYYLGNEPLLQKLIIEQVPNRTVYIEGENFDVDGLKIKAIYHNGDSKEIKDYVVIDGEDFSIDQESVTINYTENGITETITQNIIVEPKLKITSEKYKIEDIYITDIDINTTVKEFKEKIQTTALEINIYAEENVVQEDTLNIATGMRVELKTTNEILDFLVVVRGDTNGDGKADIKDILAINKHRLKKTELISENLKASDVNADNVVDIKDILKINKFRLGKINEL